MNKRLIILLVTISLASCAGRDSTPSEYSQFVLTDNLFIQSDHSSVFFQNNGPIRPNDVNQYEPFCSLNTELQSSALNPIEIEADAFAIKTVDTDTPEGESFTVGGGQKAGVIYTTTFLLTSNKQSFVHSLVCQRWAVSTLDRYLRRTEIENILGRVGKLE